MADWCGAPIRVTDHVTELAGVCVGLAAAGGFVGAVISCLVLYPACEASYSEATIVAPDALRGRLLCSVASDGSFGDSVLVPLRLAAAPVLLALVGLAVWVLFKRSAWLLPFVVAALLLPWVVHGLCWRFHPTAPRHSGTITARQGASATESNGRESGSTDIRTRRMSQPHAAATQGRPGQSRTT